MSSNVARASASFQDKGHRASNQSQNQSQSQNNSYSTEIVNKIILDENESEEEDLVINNLKDQNNNNGSPSKGLRKSSVILNNQQNQDIIDKKLDRDLDDLYKKKRISQIPFRKISTGYYDYGSQKVMVKLEGEVIRSNLFLFIF